MALPTVGCNIVGHRITPAELGLSAGTILATASPLDLTAFATAVPETLVVLCRLSSGSGTLTVDTTATGAYASATATATLSGTGYVGLVVDTDATNFYASVRLATTANMIVDRFLVLPLAELCEGEEFRSVRAGLNAVSSDNMAPDSDASGVLGSFSVSA